MNRSMQTVLSAFITTVALLSSASLQANAMVNTESNETRNALDRPAVMTQHGDSSVLLDVAASKDDLYVVGERGLILTSHDGVKWQQVASPVSVTLTGISFSDAKHGYAIGHGGAVLKTLDGGKRWSKIWDGRMLAEQLLAAAQQSGDEELIRRRQYLVDDGPDKPFLDLLQLSADHLIIVGAYGLAFETQDGGDTWQAWMDRMENFMGAHLYAIKQRGERILIAGEMGFVALSEDGGASFNTLETPYEGSFFTAELLEDGRILLSGLKGNTFVSADGGDSWKQVFNPIQASIVASTILQDGRVFMVNQAGFLLTLNGDAITATKYHAFPPLTNIYQTPTGDLLTLSIHGAISVAKGGLQ